jgi:hypothetical protein
VQRLEVSILGARKRRVARQHSTHGFLVATMDGGEKWPGIAPPQWLVEIRRPLRRRAGRIRHGL